MELASLRLPSRTEWEQQRPARESAPEGSPTAGAGAVLHDAGPSRTSRSRLRTVIELGAPLLVIIALVIVLLNSGGGSAVPGSLQYDPRAAPLLASLTSAREFSLRSEPCRGCADVAGQGGGCSGFGTDWTCDVPVTLHRPDPQIRPAQLPATSDMIETYKVTWPQNGCWTAVGDCVRAAGSAGNVCPPPVPVILHGCIGSG